MNTFPFRTGQHIVYICLLFGFVAGTLNGAGRVKTGLQAIYDFNSTDGPVVKDRSGVQPALDLRIADLKAVRRTKGSLEVRAKTVIRSDKPSAKIFNAVRRSGAITIEAWIKPANTQQDGPARVVTLSRDSTNRNFTLGQKKDRFEVRLRTSGTSLNGIPALAGPAKTAKVALTHVIYTRNPSGRARVFINGKLKAEQTVPGTISNWTGTFRLALANELSGDRSWLGTYFLVAIYSRALSAAEVAKNFTAGARAEAEASTLAVSPNADLFETKIAPLFAKHCVECHDPATHKGKLDLTRKATAFADGESIVAGKAGESVMWEVVSKNEMPKKRPPLSAEEKMALKQWIDGGASWTVAVIDPANYTNESHARQNWVRRLTIPEYIETVRATVGVDIGVIARRVLPPDLRADGFSNTAYNLNVDLKHVDAFAQLADIIVKRMDVPAFAQKFSRGRKFTDKDMRPLIAKMGQWLLRGPLEEREVVAYRGITTTLAAAGVSYQEAVGAVIKVMLQSPRFIYRIENQQGDGTPWPVGGFELASRLSYIIWGGPPDKELLRAAEAGELSDRNRVAEQVRRMLQDSRTVDQSARFISEWLDLDRLADLRPNAKKFPHWNAALAADMRTETLAFFREVIWKQKRPLSDLFNAQVTFASPHLASHYGLKTIGNKLARYNLAAVPGRGGLLTQGSVLTVGGDEASMVARGLFVFQNLLRGVVKDPPPCVDTTPVPSKIGLTQRAIAEQRIANTKCAGCHSKFEPLAFGLEKFNGMGAYHNADEHGNRLREDGEILFPGSAKSITYRTSAELMDHLAGSERVRETLTWKVSQFCLGRPLTSHDARHIRTIHNTAWKNGGTYGSLITAIVMSDLVLNTQTEIHE